MIRILDNMLDKLRQRRLAMRGPWQQDWRSTHGQMPFKAFDCNISEEFDKSKHQVKYDFTVMYGRKMYCSPNGSSVEYAGQDLFETVRHDMLGDVISAVYDIRSSFRAGSYKEAAEGIDKKAKNSKRKSN